MMSAAGRLDQAPPRSAMLWGDGFADDTLDDLWAVSDWDACSSDEYIFRLPRLEGRTGQLPPALRTSLEQCVATRARRAARSDPEHSAASLRSRLPDSAFHVRHDGDWFAPDDVVSTWSRRVGLIRPSAHRSAIDRLLLRFLDGVLFDVQRGGVPSWDETAEVLVAFGAGFHPAFLWPPASSASAKGIVAGWLGHLDRGRSALMPAVVAEYLLDLCAVGDASTDPVLALIGGGIALGRLQRMAAHRLAGYNPAVRLTLGSGLLVDFLDHYMAARVSDAAP